MQQQKTFYKVQFETTTQNPSATSNTQNSQNQTQIEKKPIDQTKLKTQMCRHMLRDGKCQFEDKCAFAHNESELRPFGERKPKNSHVMCKNWLRMKSCPYGNRCDFAHGDKELQTIQKLVQEVHKAVQKEKSDPQPRPVINTALDFPPLPVRPEGSRRPQPQKQPHSQQSVPVAVILKKPTWPQQEQEQTGKGKEVSRTSSSSSVSSLSDQELMEFTNNFLFNRGKNGKKLEFTDLDEEMDYEEMDRNLSQFVTEKLAVKTEQQVEQKTEVKAAIKTEKPEMQAVVGLEDRIKNVKISDLSELKTTDPDLFKYCVGYLLAQKVLPIS